MDANVSSNNKIDGGSMKNFVIATASVVALLSAAHAEEKSNEMTQSETYTVQTKEKESRPATHKRHAHKRHRHHKHAHRGHGHPGPLAVFVNYPPVNPAAFSACACEYYQGKQECPYVYHEGYYWYPHARAELLAGYTPQFVRGSYWYPSRLHPHAIYIDKQNMMPHEVYPVQIGEHMGKMHKHRAHHKGHMKHHGKAMHHEKAMHHAKEMHHEKEMPAQQ